MSTTRTLATVFAVVLSIPAMLLAISTVAYPQELSTWMWFVVIGGFAGAVGLVAWGRSTKLIRAVAVVLGWDITVIGGFTVAAAMQASSPLMWLALLGAVGFFGGMALLSWGWTQKKAPHDTREAFTGIPHDKPEHPSAYVADEITKLAELRKAGILSEEEFNAQKTKLLSQPIASDRASRTKAAR